MRQKQVFINYELRTGYTDMQYSFCPLCGDKLVLQPIESNERMTCLKCGFIHFKNPLPTVSIIAVKESKILLGQRLGEPGRGKWAFPSGYIDFDEDFLTAAIREMKEETGLEISIRSILNVVSSFISLKYHFLGLYLLADVTGGKLQASDDLVKVDWFPLTGPFPTLAFEEDRHVLEMYIESRHGGIPVDSSFLF